jgi:putative membrane protein
MLSPSDHDRIAKAVAEAEAATSGEILCVLAHKVSNYRETPLAWGAAAALLLPPIAVAFGLHQPLVEAARGGWSTGTAGADAIGMAVFAYAVAQVLVFAVVALVIAALAPLKRALTPKPLKHRRVRQAAMNQLLATRLLGSEIGAAVVIFASIEDRMVVVVGDEAIHKKVGDEAWDRAVAAVLGGVKSGRPADGFVEAVRLCGALLAEHFPADGKAHHLADGVVEV